MILRSAAEAAAEKKRTVHVKKTADPFSDKRNIKSQKVNSAKKNNAPQACKISLFSGSKLNRLGKVCQPCWNKFSPLCTENENFETTKVELIKEHLSSEQPRVMSEGDYLLYLHRSVFNYILFLIR
jgi:hypothetical protein